MPKKTTESRHAEKLRELEFEMMDKEASLVFRELMYENLTRNQRRLLRKAKYRPWFSHTEITTHATDETGQTWIGPPGIDLTTLGFENRTEELKATRELVFGPPVTRH